MNKGTVNSKTTQTAAPKFEAKDLINSVRSFAVPAPVKDVQEPPVTTIIKIVLTGNETPEQLLQMAFIDPAETIEQEPVCIEVGTEGNLHTLGTLGNFSLIIGKAKSRKTFFHSFFLAAWINTGILRGIFKATPQPDKATCLYFDTEQSTFHAHRVLNRVLRLAGLTTSPNFKGYGLRRFKHAERVKIIEHAIYNTPNLGLVVIDGIRDLVSDINNPDEASNTASNLLKWTEENNIHIVCILHQNKGDNNARGHLGSELLNKAETTISVTKEGEISIVAPEYCREKEFEPFAFGIDLDGLPTPVDYTPAKSEKIKSINPNNMPEEIKRKALINSFANEQRQKRNTLITNLQLSFSGLGYELGQGKLRSFLQDYENSKMVMKEGKVPHTYFSINILG